jgi:sugar O-acyltransferase (sialic acid O-acetyltransferase NeuD family)
MAAIERPGSWLVYTSRSAYSAEVAEIIWRTDAEVAAFVDNLPDGPEPSPLARVIGPQDLTDAERRLPTAIALMTPGHRCAVEAEARSFGLDRFPALLDPTSVIARTAHFGEGTVVNAQSVVGARSTLGRFVHINRSVSIGHDAELHDFVTLGPACVLAGYITVESGAFIGAGAIIAPRVRIGRNATVGAGTVVVRDVPERAVVVGNPAKVLRTTEVGYDGVGVADDWFTP